MNNEFLRHERTHSAVGQAVTEKLHGGHAISERTDGALERKVSEYLARLNAHPLELRDEYWAAAIGGVKHAHDLLADGRRAKAGKVLANVKDLIEYAI